MKSRYVELPEIENAELLCPASGEPCPTLTFLTEQSLAAQKVVDEYEERAMRWGDGPISDNHAMKAWPYRTMVREAEQAAEQVKDECEDEPKTKREILRIFGAKITECAVLADGQTIRPVFSDKQS